MINKKKRKIIYLFLLIISSSYLFHLHYKNKPQPHKEQWMTIKKQPASIKIHKYGKISPSDNYSIIAPFEGKILNIYYRLGDIVKKGDKLISLSTESVLKKQHQAQSDFLQKKEDYEKYLQWHTSSDVIKAKQSISNAKQQLKISQGKLKDDHFLYQKGIISRDELDQQKQTVEQNQQQIDSAKLALKDILKQGSKDNMEIKKLAMNDAKNSLNLLNKQISQAIITSPATGIALKPTQSDSENSSNFVAVAGEAVHENQNLLTIGDSKKLIVTSGLNQEEINIINTKMPVTITSDAFPKITLQGIISSISQFSDDSFSSSPTFPFTVTIKKIPKKSEKLIHMGLMVDIAIQIYTNPEAIIIPINAILNEPEGKFVWVKTKKHQSEKRKIECGHSLPEGIVVKKGLKVGEKIKVLNS